MRGRSWLGSLLFHGTLIWIGIAVPLGPPHPSRRPQPNLDYIREHQSKILYYDLRQRAPLPEVTPEKRIGTAEQAQGREQSPRTIIAQSPDARSSQQLIWRPEVKIEVAEDKKAPDVVQTSGAKVEEPPKPKTPPKKFELPVRQPPKPQEPKLLQAARISAPNNPNLPSAVAPVINAEPPPPPPPPAPAPRRVPKKFVPPPDAPKRSAPQSKIIAENSIGITPRQDALKSDPRAGMANPLAGIANAGAPPPPAPAPPVSPAPGAGTEGPGGSSKVNLAVVNRNPDGSNKTEVPEGQRAGQFSKAPNAGEPSSGKPSGAGLVAPDLAISGGGSAPNSGSVKPVPPAPAPAMRTIEYAERIRSVSISTLAVALRPSNRTIPRDLEAKFRGRNVYTMVVPIENISPYVGDWIFWFAEKDVNSAGGGSVIRSPIPVRKREIVDPVVYTGYQTLRVQVSGTLLSDGHLEGIEVRSKTAAAAAHYVGRDLGGWLFKPATRNGLPVDIDFVLEMSINLPNTLVVGSQP